MNDEQRAVMQQALEALEWTVEQAGGPVCAHIEGVCFCRENNAINAARAALAAPQPATGKWATIPVDPTPAMLAAFKSAYKDGNFWLERIHGAVHAMLAAAPQPAQEPAANEQAALIVRGCCEAERANPDDPETICINVDDLTAIVGLYTTPQAPQPLTPEEIDKIYRDLPSPVQHWQLARAIEAAHGITKGPAA